ncbi:O-antigen ligase domain-containing protein [Sphingomonas populi]|uniref:O-antigen ligase domain-containing protein n=1 Tax=Sphingomonas populi TaxID=2484750 RepID=A0A4Q6XSG5_9SPHN|nr:O-antigen ligase family protein [Sphingomonas populi]RZF63413.1 O-antigen ligase domain-containing protein [Sphingomonas populi]
MSRVVSHRHRAPFRRSRDSVRAEPRAVDRGSFARRAVFAAMVLLVLSLCYKIAALGVVVMLALGVTIWSCRTSFRRFDSVFVLALAYIADATVTSFMVSYPAGVARTVQFCIIAIALIGLYAYAQSAKRADAEALLKGMGVLCALVTAHLVIWHVLHHHLVTWKYLSDTKLILSLALMPLFGLEDWIKSKGRYLFPALLLAAFAIILLSGERKALILFCALFALCRFSLSAKLGLAGMIGAVAAIALLLDDGYIHRELTSAARDYSHTPTRYFFTVQSIYDRSDIVREFVNRNAWTLFTHHPAFGVGATGYWAWAAATYGPTGFAMNVHGEVHRIPAEGGMFGIAIVASFFALALWRALRHLVNSGGFAAGSLDRMPLYGIILLLSYCYAEAVDTAMLLLIGGVGVIVGTLPAPGRSLRARGERPAISVSPARAPVPSGSLRSRA